MTRTTARKKPRTGEDRTGEDRTGTVRTGTGPIVGRTVRTKTVERTRTHYARSRGDLHNVRVEAPLAVDLELPTSFARDLRALLLDALTAGDIDQFEIAIDVPVRVWLRPMQVEQLVAKLAEVAP